MTTFSITMLCVVGFLLILTIVAAVKIVPQSETRVIERLGRFHSVLNPGLNIIWPYIDKPKVVNT
ncbi:MAG: SPFH/Band 7/PHB domain protein, partial [Muribaculaceae bacterium]|nr:SPFH/Band 7/PHB domain protein [Muribaculaceae bacterium]